MTEADIAAAHWGGRDLRLIRARENTVYQMRLPDGGLAALRLHREGYQAAAAIRSELWWCEALAGAGLPVPGPVPSASGEMLVGLDGGRHASAVRWLAGAPFGLAGVPLAGPAAERVARHRALGELVARVHAATDKLTLPKWFQRPRWDVEGLVGEAPLWGRFWDHPALERDEGAELAAARQFLHDQIGRHASAGGDFGLIHADVLRENVLVNEGALSLIDFDDSGFGFRLYDLGTVMSQSLYQADYVDLRDALAEGYGGQRAADVNMIEVFTLARTCASVGWTMPRVAAADPVHRGHIARAVMCFRKVAG